MESTVKALFGGASLLSDGGSPFYAKGSPIDNPFYPFYDKKNHAIVLLTPDATTSTMNLLQDSLTKALSQVFMGKMSVPKITKWAHKVYNPFDQSFHDYSAANTSLHQPGFVYLGVAQLPGSMASHLKALHEVMALTHSLTALTLIGCSPTVERTS